jgi:hypothetical protein
LFLLLSLAVFSDLLSQEKPVVTERPPYDRREEILYNGKRYRLYNNYITLGPGFLNSTIRTTSQRSLGLDFIFHIRRQYFQTGVMMSGPGFGDNNNIQGHVGYGYRRERNTLNFGGFIGPSYHTGVEGAAGSPAVFYEAFGVYGSVHAITKFLFDIGLGLELFGDVSQKQSMFGFKIVAFFSNAYRGPKKNINPHVRSENTK